MMLLRGFCPNCGARSLAVLPGPEPHPAAPRVESSPGFVLTQVGEASIECSNIDCTNRYAAQDILNDDEIDHVVHFTPGGFSIRHPLRERIKDQLLSCSLHTHLEEFAPNYLGFKVEIPGRYRVTSDGEGEDFAYHFEKVGIPGS